MFPKYKPAPYTKDAGYLSVADNVHDYPLQLAAGIGIPGLLLLYAFFVWTAIRSGKIVFRRPDPAVANSGGITGDRIVLLGLWAACFGYVSHLFFGLSVTGSTFLLWVFLGALLAPTATSRDVKAPSWGIYPAVAVVLLAAIGVGFWGRWLYADHDYLLARVSSDLPTRLAAVQAATRLNPWNDMYLAEVGLAHNDEFIQLYQKAYQAQASGQDATQYAAAARQSFNKADQAMQNTIKFVPNEYDNYVFLSALYNLGASVYGDPTFYDKAIRIAKEGIVIEPFGPAIRYQYARALSQTNQTDEAITQLKYAIALDPAFYDGALALADIYKTQGDYAGALAVLKAVQPYVANNPKAVEQAKVVSDTIAAVEASSGAVSP